MKGIKFMSAALLYLAALSGTAFAQDAAFDLPLTSSAYIKDYESFKLAANESTDVQAKKPNSVAPEVKKSDFEPSFFSGSNAHKYLGLGTIVAAALTAVTAPEGCEQNCTANTPRERNGTHAKLARATVAMATATVITGVLAHWDDISLADGFTDPDNLHALLGIAGALVMAKAVNKSAGSATPVSHAAMAELGALSMVAAIKITW
jgi:hypothetical protein